MKQKLQPKLNEHFYLNKRGTYDLYRVDPRYGFFRHVQEMNYLEYQAYQAQNNFTVQCKPA